MDSQVSPNSKPAKNILHSHNGARSRAIKDKLTEASVTLGGTLVFVALLLIFFYLLYVVKPIFDGADVTFEKNIAYEMSDTLSLMVGSDEQNEVLYRVSTTGQVDFYSALNGQSMGRFAPTLPANATVISAAASTPETQTYALGLDNGQAIIGAIGFGVTYPDNVRVISPKVTYPIAPIQLTHHEGIERLAFAYQPQKMSFAYQDGAKQWWLTRLVGEENMMTEEVEWSQTRVAVTDAPKIVQHVLMTPDQRQLLLQAGTKLFIYDIRYADELALAQVVDLERQHAKVNEITLLAGASSILVAYDDGVINQLFQVLSPKGRLYQVIRDFKLDANVVSVASEFYRKSFVAVTDTGELSLLYTTSQRQLFDATFDLGPVKTMGFSPRSNALVVDAGNKLHLFKVENSHPEVSWSALWSKVWYEGYPEPKYVWQSTSGSDDFEAKLSLMPLVFGTMKAALYAMVFAVPLAIGGAVYTAYFMSAKVRSVVKPTIEIMEALPTVILGFLAGLWLAPLIENNLPAVVALIIVLPLSIIVSALLWHLMSAKLKERLPDTYRELMLLPILIAVTYGCFSLSPMVEIWLFDGNTRKFITNELGITFDQRNALVVGIAMGFAVIPTIFSIAEDAIFSVPRHLSNGSLALGATQWQTLTRVVLLTASPGIFSAVMMGLGRAVGETMIVLMATGNTPIMEWSVLEGMRSLSANIAVEMPESAIGSTHYRVLFLAAFVLFIITFFFNTIAEVVRQRLRERYSSL
ncbi:ABC transporter permease subunit [Shewanella sp. NIFS-20-20]|uniref:ABC transporter permease subunit n=1 Tax=Shewanella sp. NIFS-20-20 TaxID=2853806 RepID=UPI001C45EB66|nr:ABC transporter permease subunit [Shewanella sp. NIFS-20-20]MBV7316532.1 ABC transporter permease subunit [Shewanella sp. NIFS-20-20]